jgi:tripartite-type tricarboxylate transporter receptor subunit TctC
MFMLHRTRRLIAGFLTLFALVTSASIGDRAFAADWPTRPIRMIVTFPPGGSADPAIRLIAPYMSERLGQPIVIDNRPGAGGNLGLSILAKAPADGYTFSVGSAGALAANSSLYTSMPFDVQKDLAPVGLVAETPFVVVGNPSLAPSTLPELIALAQSKPGSLAIGHGGNGTAMHLSVALLEQMAGIRFNQVPYKGTGPATVDVMANQLPLAMSDLPAALEQIKAGKLRAYATTSPHRLPQMLDMPTIAEAGVPGYEATGWFGVVAPADTPPAIIERMNEALNAALNDKTIASRIRALGVEPRPGSVQDFDAFIRSETEKWGKVVRQAHIKID